MKAVLLFFTVFISSYGYSQESNAFVNKKVDDFIINLHQKGIEKIIVSDTYTKTMDAYNDNCLMPYFEKVDIDSVTNHSDYLLYYVIWASQEKVFIKKFDFCKDYEVISFSNKKLLSTIQNSNFDSIYKEEILPNQHIENGIVIYSMVTCGNLGKLFFYSKDFKFSKPIDYHNLSNENNMNYKHNSELDIIKLDRLLSTTIKELDSNDKFLSNY